MLTERQRRQFDRLLEAELSRLPEELLEWLESTPLIVEDEPTPELLRELDMDPDEDDLCGLHDGIPLTERSVEHSAHLPDHIMIFRGPVMRLAGDSRRELRRQIHITLLHELGHHFGLDEDDLEALGYG